MTDEDVQATLLTLSGLYEALVGTLENERAALRAHSYEQLGQATDQKAALCAEIEARMSALPCPLADLLSSADADNRENLDLLHNNLCEVAREAKDFNAVNGKIISRSQQSVRELIGVINGYEPNALYGAHGTALHGHSSGGPAIANA